MAITITKPAVNISERLSNLDGISLENFKAMDVTVRTLVSGGRVGIGTDSPTHGLVISDAFAGDDAEMRRITIATDTLGVNSGYRFDSKAPNDTARAGGYYFVPGDTNADTYLGLSADDADYQMVVTRDGKVGIGTTTITPNVDATVTLDHPNHGVLLGYRDSYPASGGGLFSTSGVPASYPFDKYGHLILATRTDFGSNYDIIFTTAETNDTPVERMTVKSQGAIVIGNGPTEVTLVGSKSIADNVATNFLRVVGPSDSIYGHLELTYNLDDPGNQHYVGKYTFRVFHNGTQTFFDTITSDNFSLPPSFAFTFSASGGNFDIAVTTNTNAANYTFGWCAKYVSNNFSNLINI